MGLKLATYPGQSLPIQRSRPLSLSAGCWARRTWAVSLLVDWPDHANSIVYYVGAQSDRACTLQATRQDGYTSGLGAQGRADRRRGEEGARRGGHDAEEPDRLRGPKCRLGRSGEPHQLANHVLEPGEASTTFAHVHLKKYVILPHSFPTG